MSTDFLFVAPSPIYGIGRLLDLGVQLDFYNESLTPAMADFLALSGDWLMVGQDLQSAFKSGLEEVLAVGNASRLEKYAHMGHSR